MVGQTSTWKISQFLASPWRDLVWVLEVLQSVQKRIPSLLCVEVKSRNGGQEG
jgi:hypothetical protein